MTSIAFADIKTAAVTGAAGFLGSHLTERLLADGVGVVGYDNFSTGQPEFLVNAMRRPNFKLIEADLLDDKKLCDTMQSCDAVFHVAANADVRFGLATPRRDLEQNTLATFNVLDAMRRKGVRKIVFISSAAIYGNTRVIPTPEDVAFPSQTSLYGASKLAGEGLISAYCEGFSMQSWIFRPVSLVGERYNHGHAFDFYKKLSGDPSHLDILGDGRQRKSYIYVLDFVEAILTGLARAQERVNIFNVGLEEYCEVSDSVNWITESMGVKPQLRYTGGDRGWVGDNPFVLLDTRRIRSLGWKQTINAREGITRSIAWLKENRWLLDRRR